MLDVKAKLTYADYLEMSDDERYELLNGDLFLSPSPSELHQYLLSVLHLRIGSFARDRNLGKVYFSPFDVVLSDTDVVQRICCFISSDRLKSSCYNVKVHLTWWSRSSPQGPPIETGH